MSIERLARCLTGAVLLACAACASPLGGEDLELAVGPSVLPGVGASATVSQRIANPGDARLDFEVDYAHQELDEEGPTGKDDWDRVRAGLKLLWPAEADWRWTARFGGVWARALGDPEFLDSRGDYGGVYLGAGFEFPLGKALATGPELSVSALDSEGSGDFGWVPEITWRLIWRL